LVEDAGEGRKSESTGVGKKNSITLGE